jgi:tRNA threonylcarbamoyl adenosine modification protein YjeE
LAELVALKLTRGDTIALSGDLGSGKTTFARALIRAILADPEAEVPSPTFSLVQTYDTPRLALAHLDLYRIASEDETAELGADEALAQGAIIVEWPERAPGLVSPNRLEIRLSEGTSEGTRRIGMTGFWTWARRLERVGEIAGFLAAHPPWSTAGVRYLQGDASTRAYARLATRDAHAVLMDQQRQPDGPPIRDGLPYSRIAHLAEDVRPFVAVQGALRDAGLTVPEIYAADLERGLVVLEDLGDRVFGSELEGATSQAELWRAATDALVVLANIPVLDELPLRGGSPPFRLPPQDRGVLEIETELLLDWYWPAVKGEPAPGDVRAEFHAAWTPVFDRILAMPAQWILRDYHSPNLMWLPGRTGVARVGILDFQDALKGPAAYDLVSLLEDARVDVAADLEDALFVYYCAGRREQDPAFDRDAFAFAYAALGAQRNTKILGIFARLARRDGKPLYLRHIPRLWRYLARNFAHPDLAPLRAWYDRHFPPESRDRALEA